MDDGISLTEKQAWLRLLKEARASGALRVKFDERDITYRSLAEMDAIISGLEDEIGAGQGRKRKRVGFASYGSGL